MSLLLLLGGDDVDPIVGTPRPRPQDQLPGEIDPYRVDVLLTNDGDFALNARGGMAASAGPANCAQAIVLWLRCHPGEIPLHQDYGCRLLELLIGAHTDAAIAASQARRALAEKLASDPRLTAVRDITARQVDANTTAIAATFVLISGEQLLASSLSGDVALQDLQLLPASTRDLSLEISDADALSGLDHAVDELADDLPDFEGAAPLADPARDADTD